MKSFQEVCILGLQIECLIKQEMPIRFSYINQIAIIMKEEDFSQSNRDESQNSIELTRFRKNNQKRQPSVVREGINQKQPLSKQELSIRFDQLQKLCLDQLSLWNDQVTLKQTLINMKTAFNRIWERMSMPNVVDSSYLPLKARKERIQQRVGHRILSFDQIFEQMMVFAGQAQYSLKSQNVCEQRFEERQIRSCLLIKNQRDVNSLRLIAKILKKGTNLDKLDLINNSFRQFISLKKRIDKENQEN